MKRNLFVIALALAASGAFAAQETGVVISGQVATIQVGSVNSQQMSVGSINSANTNVRTKVTANDLGQLQVGTNNRQVMQIGSVLPSAPTSTALRTDVTVLGSVVQLQGGNDNFQRARIGVIH